MFAHRWRSYDLFLMPQAGFELTSESCTSIEGPFNGRSTDWATELRQKAWVEPFFLQLLIDPEFGFGKKIGNQIIWKKFVAGVWAEAAAAAVNQSDQTRANPSTRVQIFSAFEELFFSGKRKQASKAIPRKGHVVTSLRCLISRSWHRGWVRATHPSVEGSNPSTLNLKVLMSWGLHSTKVVRLTQQLRFWFFAFPRNFSLDVAEIFWQHYIELRAEAW